MSLCCIKEYEKRLLAKDHDLKCSQAQLEHFRKEMLEAKQIQAEGSHLLPAPEAHEGTQFQLQARSQLHLTRTAVPRH